MIYTVDMKMQPPINFSPDTIAEEVGQNIRTLLATPKGTVPFARELGMDNSGLDDPIPVLRARLAGIITSLLSEYEPRAVITQVDFVQNDDVGSLTPIIHYKLAGEVTTGE